MIYHYTSIETLALILESKKIRFNNLMDVDDILEGSLFNKSNLAQFIFVSCWTKEEDENVALWKIYTNGKGVRIGLPEYPWKKVDFDFDKWKSVGFKLNYDTSKTHYSPFGFTDVFAKNHFIMPPFFMPYPNNEIFSKDIVYLDDDLLSAKYKAVYEEVIDTKAGRFELRILPTEFGKYKHKRWEFQNEFRFVLFICPLDKEYDFLDQNAINIMNSNLYDYLSNEKESPIKDFYVNLSDEAIKNMEITMGPLSTKAEEILLTALLTSNGIEKPLRKSLSAIRR